MASPRGYTVSELTLKVRNANSARNPGNNLMKNAGLEVEWPKLTKEKQLCYGIVGHLLLAGRVAPDNSSEASATLNKQLGDLSAKTDALLKSVDQQKRELVKSLEFTQHKVDSTESETAALRAELKTLQKDLREKASAPVSEHKCAVLISGLIEEETTGHELLTNVDEFLTHEVDPAVRIHVQEVHRMGRFEEGKGARRVKVVLGSASEAQAVLRAARNLKNYNQKQKEAGSRPVGIDQFLSIEELAKKRQLWPAWQEARKRKAPKTYWKGAVLIVEGQEVQP